MKPSTPKKKKQYKVKAWATFHKKKKTLSNFAMNNKDIDEFLRCCENTKIDLQKPNIRKMIFENMKVVKVTITYEL